MATAPVKLSVKPGWKTSEFWLTCGAWLVAAFLDSGLLADSHPAVKVAAIAAATLAQLGYVASRAKVKA